MAHLPMKQVVIRSEYDTPRIFDKLSESENAKGFLVAQMYTDAVFNSDIRVIQTIINRIDGGLPKDTELAEFRTLFGDCMNQVLALDSAVQLKVMPDDSVMMALCKSLFAISSDDIYHVIKSDKHGNKWAKPVNPSTERKQARDSALRLVLERAGGRKTASPANKAELPEVKVASWVTESLPQEEEHDGATG